MRPLARPCGKIDWYETTELEFGQVRSDRGGQWPAAPGRDKKRANSNCLPRPAFVGLCWTAFEYRI